MGRRSQYHVDEFPPGGEETEDVRVPARIREGACSLIWALLVLCFTNAGCAVHQQVQYFAATDPETGLTNYYRMTVVGSGGWGVDYHLQAGYFSSAAVDIIRGSMPDVPGLDLDLEHEDDFRNMASRFRANLLQECKRIARITDPESRYRVAREIHATAREAVEEAQREAKRIEGELAALDEAAEKAERAVGAAETALTTAQERLTQLESAPTPDPQAVQAAKDRLAQAERAHSTAVVQLEQVTGKRQVLLTRKNEINAEMEVRQRKLGAVTQLMNKLWDLYVADLEAGPDGSAERAKPPAQFEDEIKQLARLLWYASLSDADLISIGMTQNTNPFQFRKLVFWASAANIDLNAYSTEIDAVLTDVTNIASSYRELRRQRKQAAKSKRAVVEKLFEAVMPGPNAELFEAVFDMVLPPSPDSAGTETDGG